MKKIIVFILLSFVFLLGSCADRYTKNWAKKSLEKNQEIILIDNYLELRYTENYSIGFSLLKNIDLKIRKPFIIILQSIIIIFLLFYIYRQQNQSFLNLLPFIIILAGAFGNLFDRIQRSYVIDFIYFHINNAFS